MGSQCHAASGRQRLGQATQVDRFVSRVSEIVVLNEEHFSPSDRSLFSHVICCIVNTNTLYPVHNHAVYWTFYSVKLPRKQIVMYQVTSLANPAHDHLIVDDKENLFSKSFRFVVNQGNNVFIVNIHQW